MERVSFPKLGISIPVTDTAITLFGIEIKWYAIIITTGIFLAWVYISKRSRQVGLHPDNVFDVIFGGIVGGVIGARLYYVVFEWEYYSHNLDKILDTRSGGLAFYGGLIGGLLVGILIAKWKKVYIPPLLDLVGPAFLLGQAIGRWGNFFNEEAFGANTTLPWGMTSPKIQATLTSMKANMGVYGEDINPLEPVHPCFLYESIWCAIGFVLLHFYSKRRRKFDGDVFLLYLGWYGFGRFFIEGLRTDSLYWGPFRVSQVLSLLLCVGALLVRFLILRKIKTNPEKYPLYKDTEKSKEILLETDEKKVVQESKKKQKKATEDQEKSVILEEESSLEVAEAIDDEKIWMMQKLVVLLQNQIDRKSGL